MGMYFVRVRALMLRLGLYGRQSKGTTLVLNSMGLFTKEKLLGVTANSAWP